MSNKNITGVFRNRRIKYAVVTSSLSKVLTLVAQAIAIPITIEALGIEKYGAFVMLSTGLAWMSIASVSVGPGLTKGITTSVVKADLRGECVYFSTSFFLVTFFSVIIFCGLLLIFSLFTVEDLFGDQYQLFSKEIRYGFFLVSFLLIIQVFLSTVEAAQAGYQEQYINNLWGGFGNGVSIALLFAVAFYWPTICGIIFAIYGANVTAKLLNGICLVVFLRPYLLPRLRNFEIKIAKSILSMGMAFFLVQISSFIIQQASVYMVGRMMDPKSVSTFSVIFRLVILGGGLVVMITQPLWPAYMDAIGRKDGLWVRKIYNKTTIILMSYAILAGLIIALFGQQIIEIWIGPKVIVSSMLQKFMGLFFVCAVWKNIHYTTLVGLGLIWPAAIVMMSESLIMIVIAISLIPRMGNTGAAAGLVIASACCSAWLLPVMTKRTMARVCATIPK